jgi:hypothetical protein
MNSIHGQPNWVYRIILCCPLVFPGSPFPLPGTDSACPFSGEQCLPKWAHPQCRSFCTGTDCRRSRHPQTGGQRGRKSQAHSRRMSRPIVFVYEHGHAALNFCHMIDPSIFDRFAPQDRPRYRTTDACQPELRQAHGRVHEGCHRQLTVHLCLGVRGPASRKNRVACESCRL